jgi:TolA-binding protein
LYDTAFAAFMVGDYDYAQQVSQRYKDVYPENDTIYDIDILCL